MKYVSVDIETTGIDPENNQIIEFGAIIEDTKNPKSYDESPKFRRIVLQRTGTYVGSAFALNLNSAIFKIISEIDSGKGVDFVRDQFLNNDWCFDDELIPQFKKFLFKNDIKESPFDGVLEIVAAGKNFGSFDKQFIQKLPEFETYGLKFHYRSLDPTLKFIDWNNDETPPSTNSLKKRANLSGVVSHEALDDAWDVIQLLRVNYVPTPFETAIETGLAQV